MEPDQLRTLLELVAGGALTVDQAIDRCDPAAMASLPGATVDLGRAARCGFGEVIYGQGKPPKLIEQVARRLLECQAEVLITRCDQATASELQERFPCHRYVPSGRTLRLSNVPIAAPDDRPGVTESNDPLHQAGPVAVITAGSTDAAVAMEAAETLAWMGVAVEIFEDLGVAGPQRLLSVTDRLRRCEAIVVVAGMEGALPSVVAGHVACPVIAVPTSVGYGVAFGGVTALLGMLSSCASHVAVVNIDAGFKGGYLAGVIATRIRDAAQRRRC